MIYSLTSLDQLSLFLLHYYKKWVTWIFSVYIFHKIKMSTMKLLKTTINDISHLEQHRVMEAKMAETDSAFPGQALSVLLSVNATLYSDFLTYFDDYLFDIDQTHQKLIEMRDAIHKSHDLLNDLFTNNINVSQLLPYFDWLQDGRTEFYQLYNGCLLYTSRCV